MEPKILSIIWSSLFQTLHIRGEFVWYRALTITVYKFMGALWLWVSSTLLIISFYSVCVWVYPKFARAVLWRTTTLTNPVPFLRHMTFFEPKHLSKYRNSNVSTWRTFEGLWMDLFCGAWCRVIMRDFHMSTTHQNRQFHRSIREYSIRLNVPRPHCTANHPPLYKHELTSAHHRATSETHFTCPLVRYGGSNSHTRRSSVSQTVARVVRAQHQRTTTQQQRHMLDPSNSVNQPGPPPVLPR